MSQTQPSPRPLYIPDEEESIFAFFHAPAQTGSAVAILICPPFGEEDMSSYRSRREWASHLASTGCASLRIDFPGCGDSSGGPRDPERLNAWTKAVGTSARWLSEATGARRIVAVGLGLGGLLAYRALALGAPIDDLVLWGVSAQGRKHLRELRAFSYMACPPPEDDPTACLIEHPVDDALTVSGYVLSDATCRDLEDLDLAELDCRLDRTRVLLLERDGRPVDGRLRAAVERCGAEVTVSPGDGYAAMMITALPHAVSAYGVFETVDAWLGQARGPEADLLRGAASRRDLATVATASTEISLPDSCPIRETAMTIEHPGGDLFGILAEPVGPARDLCAVWLNAGPVRRIGPSRMWVETARRWAAMGVSTFRVDLAAIGDADGTSDALLEVRAYYTADYLEQIRLVLDTLEARGLPPRFLIGGLCAGAYWSLRVAQEDPRVSAAAVLNPGYLVYDGGLSNALGNSRDLASRLLRRDTWARVVRGRISPSAHLHNLLALLGGLRRLLIGLPSRLPGREIDSGEPSGVAGAFDRLREQSTRALVLFAGEEQLYTRLSSSGELSEPERWPNISIEHIPVAGDNHTLRPLALQREAHRRVDELLNSELERIAVKTLEPERAL